MFQFRPISEGLIRDLIERSAGGESLVLLGSRQSGKRKVVDLTLDGLAKRGRTVVRLGDMGNPSFRDSASLAKAVWSAARKVDSGVPEPEPSDPFSTIERLSEMRGSQVWLVASNVDRLSPPIVKQFLQGARALVSRKLLVAVFTGEQDLRDLVLTGSSEFNVASHFVLQWMELDVFRDAFDRWVSAMGLICEDVDFVCQELWQVTRGSAYFMRLLLFQYLEGRARKLDGFDGRLRPGTFCEGVVVPESSLADLSDQLRYAQRRVSSDPDCWDSLSRLLAVPLARIPVPGSAPGTLEFAGLAVRLPGSPAMLEIRSPLIYQVAQRYWNSRRFADLQALQGNWDAAFQLYGRLPSHEKARPSDADDRVEVDRLLSALASKMQSEAHLGLRVLQRRFVYGIEQILGLEALILEHNGEGQSWGIAFPDVEVKVHQEVAGAVKQMLPSAPPISIGSVPLGTFGSAVLLETEHDGSRVAAVAGSLRDQEPLTRERLRMVERLLAAYQQAHGVAVTDRRARQRLAARDEHFRVTNAILDQLGRSALSVDRLLDQAALGLRGLGYHRVEICLVDPSNQRIRGIVDKSDTNINVADMTDFPLDPPSADIQPWVVHTREAVTVTNPTNHPLINKQVLANVALRPLSVVPIVGVTGNVAGTIHVERKDSRVPSRDEVADLTQFGRQLAVLIELSEEIRLQQQAIERIPDPTCLVGLDGTSRYANAEARRVLDLKEPGSIRFDAALEPNVSKLLRRTLDTGDHTARHLVRFGRMSDYRGTIRFDALRDWRGNVSGALAHFQESNQLERALDVLTEMAKADSTESAVDVLQKATLKLGPKWARLYEAVGNVLISKSWHGEASRLQENVKHFNEGGVTFDKAVTPSTWDCIVNDEVLAFVYLPDSHEETYTTPQGVTAAVIRKLAPNVPERPVGEIWVDFPLKTSRRVIGKLTLFWDPQWPAEQFEVLKILKEHLSVVLHALEEKGLRELKEAGDVALAAIGHNLRTRIAPLGAVYQYLKDQPDVASDLRDKINDMGDILREVRETVKRTSEMLATVNVKPVEMNLVAAVQRELELNLPANRWSLRTVEPEIQVWADPKLRTAIAEIIQNSRQIAGDEKVHVDVEIEDLGSQVTIHCRDRGVGVPNENKKKIFEAFFTDRPEGQVGSGLGLAFVDRVIRAHGGSIREEGEFGVGVHFIIVLPNRSKE